MSDVVQGRSAGTVLRRSAETQCWRRTVLLGYSAVSDVVQGRSAGTQFWDTVLRRSAEMQC